MEKIGSARACTRNAPMRCYCVYRVQSWWLAMTANGAPSFDLGALQVPQWPGHTFGILRPLDKPLIYREKVVPAHRIELWTY
jgi:hypothetical protein